MKGPRGPPSVMIVAMVWPSAAPSTTEDSGLFEGLRRRDPMHRSKKQDARLLFLWGLMEGDSEEPNESATRAERDKG